MTNAMIIMQNSIALMEQGIIKGTGKFITVEDAEGNKKQLEIPEEIHTFQYWKSIGYKVRKGEHAVAQFPIWKHTSKQKTMEDGEGNEIQYDDKHMFMKNSHWFGQSQVEAI